MFSSLVIMDWAMSWDCLKSREEMSSSMGNFMLEVRDIVILSIGVYSSSAWLSSM